MSRERFVTLCQQLLVFGVLAVVALPAARTVTLDIVVPPDSRQAQSETGGASGQPNAGTAPAVGGQPDTADVETTPVMGRWGPNGIFEVFPGSGLGQLQAGYQSHSALRTDRAGGLELFAVGPSGGLGSLVFSGGLGDYDLGG